MDKLTVSLDDYIRYLVKKWKTIIAVVLIFVLLFALSAKILGEKIVIPPSEEYLALKEEEASIGGYIENAPLMKIDSTCVQEIVIYISNISERESLKDYINSGSVWKTYEDEKVFYSFYDLVMWTDGSNLSLAEITIQHYDVEETERMAEFLKGKIREFDEGAEIFLGTPYVAADESIADVQLWYENRKNAIEGQLEYARAGYTIETNLPVAIITGVLTGGLTSVIILLIFFMFRKENK